ncbi:MAG: DUF732 domain-containing protein [Spirochaetes bacterium]|nr:MAG: DUF732 domain-containing protein [Spirochaetota bacterium]
MSETQDRGRHRSHDGYVPTPHVHDPWEDVYGATPPQHVPLAKPPVARSNARKIWAVGIGVAVIAGVAAAVTLWLTGIVSVTVGKKGGASSGSEISLDDRYLTTLATNGITYDNQKSAVEAAHAICDALDYGNSYKKVFLTALSAGVTANTAIVMTDTAISVYCPRHLHRIPSK